MIFECAWSTIFVTNLLSLAEDGRWLHWGADWWLSTWFLGKMRPVKNSGLTWKISLDQTLTNLNSFQTTSKHQDLFIHDHGSLIWAPKSLQMIAVKPVYSDIMIDIHATTFAKCSEVIPWMNFTDCERRMRSCGHRSWTCRRSGKQTTTTRFVYNSR